MRCARFTVPALAALSLFVPAGASAATAEISGTTLVFTADAGEANRVDIHESFVADEYQIFDAGTGVNLEPGPNCSEPSVPNHLFCTGPIDAVTVILDDRDDTLELFLDAAIQGSVFGGAGNDLLGGHEGVDAIDGGPGDDIYVAASVASLCPPPPALCSPLATNGADAFTGGEGSDTADYSAADTPVTVSLDGVRNDGEPGELDNVGADVENVVGGSFGDTLTGNDLPNRLDGAQGDDTIYGLGAGDLLNGGVDQVGSDTVRGGSGDDLIAGGPSNDDLAGEDGADFVVGGSETDTVDGGAGDDPLLDGGAGDDAVRGGEGDDKLFGATAGLVGADGKDDLVGGAGDDELKSGPGDDTLDGSAGSDVMSGEGGRDTVRYVSRSRPVFVSLDGRGNDGVRRERDNVASDVEELDGGAQQDDLVGDKRGNVLRSGADEDYLDGRRGGDDLAAGPARDTVRSRDGRRDEVSCGPGQDYVIADRRDAVSNNCELVDRSAAPRPVRGRFVNVRPVRGRLRLGLPRTKRTVPLGDRVDVPTGSLVGTNGERRVRLGFKGADGLSSGVFSGRFQLRQGRDGVPELVLRGGDFGDCKGGRSALGAAGEDVERSATRKDRRQGRGRNRNRYRTRGRFSISTLRGSWLVEDTCGGTRTKVISGSATVTHLRTGRTVTLGPGESFVAKAP